MIEPTDGQQMIETNLGFEIVNPGEKPQGVPVSEMSESERAAHEEAKRRAKA